MTVPNVRSVPKWTALFLIAGVSIVGQDWRLSKSEIDRAIAHGKEFKSRAEFLNKGLAPKRFKVTNDAQVTFYHDADVISAAAAEANQKMRGLTADEIERLPRTGLLFANVEVRARRAGIGGRRSGKALSRYMDGGAHLVLKIGEDIVQPVEAGAYPSAPKNECSQTMYLWSVFGNLNFAVGGIVPVNLPCASQGPEKISIEFAFRLLEAQWRPAEVILIDGNGNRHGAEVDLLKVR